MRSSERQQRVWLTEDSGDFNAFKTQVEQQTTPSDWPFASSVERNILIYSGVAIRALIDDEQSKLALMAEWVDVLKTGPGVFVISEAFSDCSAIERATQLFDKIIDEQNHSQSGGGDHFAKPGANDRIWNALEKHCVADPENFAHYYSNPVIALTREAWLGDGYQVAAQVNRVNPGGDAQMAHRDFHLGFMPPARMVSYPTHIHRYSSELILQGAIAHCDMPLESGPTRFLPYSQDYLEGYVTFAHPSFREYFENNFSHLPLKKGDAIFFNPGLMHAAGANCSRNIYRMANLLQVSAAFARPMESINRVRMVSALYPALVELKDSNTLSDIEIKCVIAAAAEGYAFPTNLDLDPPLGGLAPKTDAQHMYESLCNGIKTNDFVQLIKENAEKRLA